MNPSQDDDQDEPRTIRALLGDDAPRAWGDWGPDDEVGALNNLTPASVLRAMAEVRTGQVLTLQVPIGVPGRPDPVWPGRTPAVRTALADHGLFERGTIPDPADGHRFADDRIDMFLQGTTHTDALGHVWYDDQIWNGTPASSTSGALTKASILPIAERGVVGRGILVDMARAAGKDWLEPGETFGLVDLLSAAERQGVQVRTGDILLIRTGWLRRYVELGSAAFYAGFSEPGLRYSRDLVDWFRELRIPNLVTDLIANEATEVPGSGIRIPLHSALMRNLGVVFTEICWLEELAEACAKDDRWSFLYAAAPLKVYGASGAPVNPLVLR